MAKSVITYTKNIDEGLTTKWVERFLELGMELEFHPQFSFETINGYLPVRLKILHPKIEALIGNFKTGMELYLDGFDIDDLKPQKSSFFKKKEKVSEAVISPEIDEVLKTCTTCITFNFEEGLPVRLACLSAAVISEITGGVYRNPLSNKWRLGKEAVPPLVTAVEENEAKQTQWKEREFTEW